MDNNITSAQEFGLVIAERIRKHAETCQDLDCGFNPLVDDTAEDSE